MIYVDQHESIELELLLAQVLPTERTNLNPEKPDLWWVGYGGKSIGIELKQSGEILGSLDSVEEQLGREMQGCDYLGLAVRGIITPTATGMCQTWEKSKQNPSILWAAREFNQSYKGYRAWLWRMQEIGVAVVEVPTIEALATTVQAAYENSQKAEGEHKTFERLIPEHYWITEADQQKRNVALSLMGLRPSWGGGEELALALAERFPDLASLVNCLEAGAEGEVAKIPLRNGKRTVGPASTAKLKRSLGIP